MSPNAGTVESSSAGNENNVRHFTDIQMPGSMDGLKLARAVRGRWPPIKIVATSGHLHVRETDLPEGGRFLSKPYSATEINGVLRELICDR